MTDHSRERHSPQHEHHREVERARKRPVHHNPFFWLVVLLMLVAMGVYVFTMDDEMLPGNPGNQPVPALP
jgi:hypothetical protein